MPDAGTRDVTNRRVILLCNGVAGVHAAELLQAHPQTTVVALVLNEPAKRRAEDRIRAALPELPESAVYSGEQLATERVLDQLRAAAPDLALSVYFGHIIRPPLLELVAGRCYNVHPSYLPFNRGAHPAVWSIVEHTPAGATLHVVDEGVDTGDIVAQVEVAVEPSDTGGTLYEKCLHAGMRLLEQVWPQLVAGAVPARPQRAELATSHRVRDLAELTTLDPHRPATVGQVVDLLRARMFSADDCSVVTVGGTAMRVAVTLTDADDAVPVQREQ